MSLNAATIEFLLSKGLDGKDLLEVARRSELRADPTATERKRRQRERERMSQRDVTRDTVPPNESILTPSGSQKPSPSGEVKKFPEPAGVTAEQWQAFRKQRKKPLNARSYTLLTNKLAELAEDGWPPGDMIDLAIERGWETVFAPRNFGNVQRRDSPSPLDILVATSLGYGPGVGESP